MDPLVAKALSAGSSALIKKLFGTGKSGARLVDHPVRLGRLVRWPLRERHLAEKDLRKLVRQLMLAAADADPMIRAIDEGDGENLISSLTATLLALGSITIETVQIANLNADSLAQALVSATKSDVIALTVETQPIYDQVLNACCLQIVDHFSKAPEFHARSQVETVRRLGDTHKALGGIAGRIDTILRVLLEEEGIAVWLANDFQLGTNLIDDIIPDPVDEGDVVDLAALRLGRLPNLQLQFPALGKRFDEWLAAEPKKRTEGLRIFWIEGRVGHHRGKARLACLSRLGKENREVLDAGGDFDLAVRVLNRSLFNPGLARPPIISVDLNADVPGDTWYQIRNIFTGVRTRLPAQELADAGHDIYPRLVIGGTKAQRREAYSVLLALAELVAFDNRGLDRERAHSFHALSRLESKSVPAENIYNRGLPITTRKLVGRQKELAMLRAAWKSSGTRIISIVASGGTGKSALINAWLSEMRKHDYRGATRVLAWSFYSQGTKENLVSADPFINFGLEWLGATEAVTESLATKGVKLASLIESSHYLLVLDGMEPLQHPPTAPNVGGRITDVSLKALLEELAKSPEPGLCVITTRVPLIDLKELSDQLALGAIVEIELENLKDDEAATLLRRLIQRQAPRAEVVSAANSVDNHALAVTLLGNYIRDVYHGDLRGRFDLSALVIDAAQGGHARRIMASYVRWLEDYNRVAELSVLLVIGLFDRPAPEEAMQALLNDTDLDPFTTEHDQVGSPVWYGCVEALRGMGLLNGEIPESPGTLDSHPLVREHFREELRRQQPEKWAIGNLRLLSYYSEHAPNLPNESRGMSELYAAVTHGCASRLHQEVFDNVLLPRIWRDRRTNYSTRRLGMAGSDLVALSNYFRSGQWRQLRDVALTGRSRVLILTNAGVRLRQLGRLSDAKECFGAVVNIVESESASPEDFEDAAYAAGQYCELLVIAGQLTDTATNSDTALTSGRRAVEFAANGEDPYFKMHSRSSLAEVYLMLGELDQAKEYFDSARAIKDSKPPFLYSQSLFRYGYFLIESGNAQEILDAASDDPDWGRNGDDSSLLSRAIRLLVLGAAHRRCLEDGDGSASRILVTERTLEESIVAFRDAGYADYLVRGLLERAYFYRVRCWSEDYSLAMQDLDRAAFEAGRGEMYLLQCDILLERAACFLKFARKLSIRESRVMYEMAAECLDRARREVKRINYGRRVGRLNALLLELELAPQP